MRLPPRGCARRRVSERNRRRRLLAWRLKLSAARPLTDEGEPSCCKQFPGSDGKPAPHPALRGHLPPKGEGFILGTPCAILRRALLFPLRYAIMYFV